MPLSLSNKSSLLAQSEIRAMTLECARIGGINLAQGVYYVIADVTHIHGRKK